MKFLTNSKRPNWNALRLRNLEQKWQLQQNKPWMRLAIQR